MSVFRTILGRIDDLTAKAEDTLVAYLHGAISVMVILAVILRYVFTIRRFLTGLLKGFSPLMAMKDTSF